MKSTLLRPYVAGQVLLLTAYFFLPSDGWLHVLWHTTVAWISVAFILVGMQRARIDGALAWYLFAFGVFLNGNGLAVETFCGEFFGMNSSPTPGDALYLGLYPGLIGGLGYMVHRRTAGEDLEALILRTAGCALLTIFLGIFAWEFIIWQSTDHRLGFARRVMVTAYPLADLVLIALVLRLLFSGGRMARNASFLFFVAAVACFLAADIGWAIELRQGSTPGPLGQHLLEMCSMSAYVLVGAGALHPDASAITPAAEGSRRRLGALGWAALAICTLTAPTVVLVQALLDQFFLVTNL